MVFWGSADKPGDIVLNGLWGQEVKMLTTDLNFQSDWALQAQTYLPITKSLEIALFPTADTVFGDGSVLAQCVQLFSSPSP